MNFTLRLLYYCLLFGTTLLACFYIYTALIKRAIGQNPYYMKQWFGLASVFVLVFLYKAYQLGELQERYTVGLGVIVSSWLLWGILLLGFLILAKVQGRL